MRNQSRGLDSYVSAEIRAERNAQRLTIRDMTRGSGLTDRSYRRIESGEKSINVTELAALSSALGLTPVEVLERAQARRERDELSESDDDEPRLGRRYG